MEVNDAPNPPLLERSFSPFSKFNYLLIGVVSIGIGLSFGLFVMADNWTQEHDRIEFELDSRVYANAIQNNFDKNIEALNAFGNFFNNSTKVTRQEFSKFALSTLAHHPNIQALGWNLLVMHDERARYESQARDEGFQNFRFTEENPEGQLITAQERQEYVVVYYLEPLEGNEAAFGYTISSQADRLEAIQRAFSTGKAYATSRIRLVQETGHAFGILILLPIYQQGVTPKTLEDRTTYRKGFVTEVLRVGNVLESALEALPDAGLDIYLYDLSAGTEDNLLYFRPSIHSPQQAKMAILPLGKETIQAGTHWGLTFEIGERQWELVFRPSSLSQRAQHSIQKWIVLCSGLALTFMLGIYLSARNKNILRIEQANTMLQHEIAERQQAEDRLRHSEEQYRRSQKMEALGRLSGGIAHEFNNMLSPMLGHTEMLIKKLPKDSKEQHNLQEINIAGKRAAELVRQIMVFSRMDISVFKPLDMTTVVEKATKLAKSMIPNNIEFHQELQKDCEPVVADATQIHQIILNLCTNAYHAMEERGGIMEVTLTQLDQCPPDLNMGTGKCLRLTVKDTGHGITPEDQAQIFDPFFTTKDVGKGTGLGLSVVHGIVEKHQGKITVTSSVGQGSTFSVFFPIQRNAFITENVEGKSISKPVEKRKAGHILMVEDEACINRLYREHFKKSGYTLTYCHNGKEALELFTAYPSRYDVVLTDQAMPQMTGKQLSQELLKINPDIPIILSTGYSSVITEKEATALGIRHYIEKPIELGQLDTIIQECLTRNRSGT
jgi:signal transduction histidine kinase/CheY-like chemotaxis protein